MVVLSEFKSPSFSRVIWKSYESKKKYQKLLSDISFFVSKLEVASVAVGHRRAAWQTIAEENISGFAKMVSELGLLAVPVKRVAKFDGFAHRHEMPKKNELGNLCVIVSKSLDVIDRFRTAIERGNNITQGKLLGYPTCCCSFFDSVWGKGYYDPIWQMAEASCNVEKVSERHLKVVGHPYCNALLRYVGPRAGFHIPCSFNCEHTIEANGKRMELAEELDWKLAVELEEMLRWPVVWSALNGIGQVETEHFYIVFQSVPVIEKYVVEVSWND